MPTQSHRRVINDPGPGSVASGPWRSWRKPIPAIVADAIANSRALAARLERGMYAPDEERRAHYKAVFDILLERTRQQLKALEAFATIEWSDQ